MRAREGRRAYELTDAPPDANTPASLWVPYFAPDEASKTSNNKCALDTNYANDYICEANQTATCVKAAPSGASSADKEDFSVSVTPRNIRASPALGT